MAVAWREAGKPANLNAGNFYPHVQSRIFLDIQAARENQKTQIQNKVLETVRDLREQFFGGKHSEIGLLRRIKSSYGSFSNLIQNVSRRLVLANIGKVYLMWRGTLVLITIAAALGAALAPVSFGVSIGLAMLAVLAMLMNVWRKPQEEQHKMEVTDKKTLRPCAIDQNALAGHVENIIDQFKYVLQKQANQLDIGAKDFDEKSIRLSRVLNNIPDLSQYTEQALQKRYLACWVVHSKTGFKSLPDGGKKVPKEIIKALEEVGVLERRRGRAKESDENTDNIVVKIPEKNFIQKHFGKNRKVCAFYHRFWKVIFESGLGRTISYELTRSEWRQIKAWGKETLSTHFLDGLQQHMSGLGAPYEAHIKPHITNAKCASIPPAGIKV